MKKVRVMVVDDSVTVRRHLCAVIAGDPGLEVVAEASNGEDAIALCKNLRPDVISMDLVLPRMGGLEATEQIMAWWPTPILIVSSSSNRGGAVKTADAEAAGAVDVYEKGGGAGWEQAYLAAIKRVSRIKVITHGKGRRKPYVPSAPAPDHPPEAGGWVVAIGASTGGPAAVLDILRALPTPYPFPLLLVIHVGEPFGDDLARWLTLETRHRVVLAREGESVAEVAGHVVLATPGQHMVVRGTTLHLHQGPERHSCRPSVDVLFESMALELGPRCAAGVLTGMGRDGAAGLLAIRQAGGWTFAQDEQSSVVFGMPRAAIQLGAAEKILALKDIAPALGALGTTSRPLAAGGSR